jgi:RHO1 GDP-GTP exchange protein 1/2
MTMSGRMSGNNTSPTTDFARPVQPRQQIAPGSPRRPPPTSASSRSTAALGGVREEGPESSTTASPNKLPPITTSVSGRHESVDSAYSDMDSALVPQRSKSSSSFPIVSPSTAGTDRRPSLTQPPSSQPSISRNRAPIVYPALLSRVALALRERITLGDKQKDGLTYPNAFTGSEAVDLIAYVIKTSDRNLALLLGRALDAQRWFHDVTYVHRYIAFISI